VTPLRRWRRNMELGRRQRLAAEVDRTSRWMTTVILDLRRAGAEIPAEIMRSTASWRVWAEILTAWAEELER
jgi:hypothetical protein